jgi:hypothetical protein
MLWKRWMATWMAAALALAAPAAAQRAETADTGPAAPAELIGAAALALGGSEGGHVALAALPGYRLVYTMEVHDTASGRAFTAEHRYEVGEDRSVRLTVDVTRGKDGVDSVAYAGVDEAWVESEGEKTDFLPAEVRQRVLDFSPERLFQVPLELGPKGIDALPAEVHERLVAEVIVEGDHAGDVVVRAVDDGDEEQVSMRLDDEDGLPREASFASVAGRITYRFDDYREVSDGLVIPFRRQFLRNGILLSDLTVTAFEVGPRAEEPAEEPG